VQTGIASGATVVLMIVVAGAGGQVLKSVPPPAPQPRTLKMELEGEERDVHRVLVEGVTGLPPRRVFELVSEDGKKTAAIAPLGDAECNDVTDRRDAGYNGPGQTQWCLEIRRAPTYGAVIGTGEGVAQPGSGVGPTNLGLTLETRDAFLGQPAVVVAGGLVVSLLLALLGAVWGPLIAGRRLKKLVSKGGHIEGLGDRADSLLAGKSAKDVIKIIRPVVKKGREEAGKERTARQARVRGGRAQGGGQAGPPCRRLPRRGRHVRHASR
jgi:hypothetical protein